GVPNGNGNGSFGTPLYNITTNNALGTLNGLGTANVNANRPVGATSIGVRRSSFYTTTLDPSLIPAAPMPPARLQADLQNVLARSTRLPSAANVRVTVEGDVVVLQGTVGSERERRLTEAAVRLTPGVHDVRNELEVAGGATATAGR
ncbi:MAG TPA: BON domain-containing protein, partial [Gemmataceae bacterium]|nr:BON domain-containing protein [Gemmataceae bacterium]